MEKTNLSILFFLFLLTSLCNSQDYEYDENYNYYNENYDYYSQELNDYYGPQNLLAPAAPPPFIPPLPPSPPPPPPRTSRPSHTPTQALPGEARLVLRHHPPSTSSV